VSSLRVVLLSGADEAKLARLLRYLHEQAHDITICGVLYELPRSPKPIKRRVATIAKNLRDPDYQHYVVERFVHAVRSQAVRAGHQVLRLVHASPRREESVNHDGHAELSRICESIGAALHITADVHSAVATDFVRGLRADLGVVWGTRLLKRELFDIPRFGSVNIHRKKLPEYRGSGPTGMWELLDGQREIGIAIHRVDPALDAGPIFESAVVQIEPSDTLATLDRKVHVAGNDLLVRFLNKFASGELRATPQQGTAREFRKLRPHHLRRRVRQLAAERRGCTSTRTHSIATLLIRTLFFAPFVVTRNWMRRVRRTFPIVRLHYANGIAFELLVHHLDFLKKHYRIVSLDEAEVLHKYGGVATPTVALTFDDEPAENFNLRAALDELGAGRFTAVRDGGVVASNDLWELELILQGCLRG
jgi:methionyl-tRNA formyltransferase